MVASGRACTAHWRGWSVSRPTRPLLHSRAIFQGDYRMPRNEPEGVYCIGSVEATRGGDVQGGGFYIGLAFWPGGTVGDWGPAIDADTTVPGLSPCLITSYNGTNTTHQQYLVRLYAATCTITTGQSRVAYVGVADQSASLSGTIRNSRRQTAIM